MDCEISHQLHFLIREWKLLSSRLVLKSQGEARKGKLKEKLLRKLGRKNSKQTISTSNELGLLQVTTRVPYQGEDDEKKL